MPRPAIQFNDYVSLAIMLLMSVALIAGQADARGDENRSAYEHARSISPVVLFEDGKHIEISGRFRDKALEVSLSVVQDLGNFRGEDE